MSRGDGFAIVDHAATFLHDVKLRRLRRTAPDEAEGAIRTLLYLSLRDSSWYEGERLSVEDADRPYEATDERIAALVAVGLIDDEHRIPESSWNDWFTPAHERRERMRKAGREGSLRRWGATPDDGSQKGPEKGPYTPRQKGPLSPSVRPSDRTVRSRASARDDGSKTSKPRPVGGILADLITGDDAL